MSRHPIIRHLHGSMFVDDWADMYVGTCSSITTPMALVGSNHEEGPVSFEAAVLVDCCDYIYIAAWSNKAGQNGLVAHIMGSNPVATGQAGWEVFATGNPMSQTGSLYDRDVRPGIYELNRELARACANGWREPSVLPAGDPDMQSAQGVNGEWIWCNSGDDPRTSATPPVPFIGFDHDELLIFRLPIRLLFLDECSEACPECDCGCDDGCNGCVEDADEKNEVLIDRADESFNDVDALENPDAGTDPFVGECRTVLPDNFDGRPFFFLHWGQSAADTIENHDTEVLYVTVRNPFSDLEYRGFRIGSITFSPTPSMPYHARIVPDCLVDYGCIPPCSSVTREFTVITRNSGEYIGTVQLEVDYCYDELAVKNGGPTTGTATFELSIVEDD